jgi:acyl-CoA thioesterase FadM
MAHKTFETQKKILFREADPAGIMFFGQIFAFSHDAFEEFLPAAGFTWKEWFHRKDLFIPIRHTEADFKAPFVPGETYSISVTVAKLSENSFQMKYVFSKDQRVHALVRMVHAFVDPKTKLKTAAPEDITRRLIPYCES